MLLQDLMSLRTTGSAVEQELVRYLLEAGEGIGQVSARAIARELHIAPSSVVRFCKRLGFAGYYDFRDAFRLELRHATEHYEGVDPNYPFELGEPPIVISRKIGALYREIVDETLEHIDDRALGRATRLLASALEIVVTASGVQLAFAEGFKNKMLKIGHSVVVESRVEAALYRAAHARRGETALILLSYSGESGRILRVARLARERSAPVIALTSSGGNTLSRIADVALVVPSREEVERNLGHFAMNIATALLLDILYASIFNGDYAEHYAARMEMNRLGSRGGSLRSGRDA